MRTIAFFLFILILMGFVITNPQPQTHKSFVSHALQKGTFEQTKEPTSLAEGIGMGLGLVLGSTLLEIILEQAEYQNFFLFSILSVPQRSSHLDSSRKRSSKKDSPLEGALSLGILGQIILLVDPKIKD